MKNEHFPNKYIVIRIKDNPFDKIDYMQNRLMLCDYSNGEVGEVIADIENQDKIEEGMIVENDYVELHRTNKKSKLIVEGDFVRFGDEGQYFGILEKVVDNNIEDFWEEEMHLKNCKKVPMIKDLEEHYNFPEPNPITIVQRGKCEHLGYFYATIEHPYYTELKYTQYEVDKMLKNVKN